MLSCLLAPLGRFCSVLIFISIVIEGYGQADPVTSLKTVVPPSPNSASLGKFADWPVSLYTGVPEISVPLYNIEGRSTAVPVTLSYHASGIRVSEVASWVGLGWALDAGGVITRSIHGLPDEEPTAGYFHYRSLYDDPGDLSSSPTNTDLWRGHRTQAAKGAADGEHDTYMINALGRSYKLLFKGDGSITTMPYSLLRITADFVNKTWVVVTEDGTTLTFGTDAGHYELSTVNFGQLMGTLQFVSSWYLKTITSPLGETVTFSYGGFGIKHDTGQSQSDFIEYNTTLGETCGVTEGSMKVTISQLDCSSLVLNSIENDLVRVDFIPVQTGRLDLEGGRALSQIRRYSKLAGKYLDTVAFSYSYSKSPGADVYENYRLKLNKITRLSGNGQPQVWDFTYNLEQLPGRRSYAQDHWGYYNGGNNETLLPPIFKVLPDLPYITDRFSYGFMPGMHDLGADRNPSAQYVQAETLVKITYPTSGYTEFEFEPNSYPATEEMFSDTTLYQGMYLSSGLPYTASKSISFTTTKGQFVRLSITSSISSTIKADFPSAHATVSIIDPNGQVSPQINDDGSKYFVLPSAGTYSFRISTNVTQDMFSGPQDYVNLNASLDYEYSKGMKNIAKGVGGFRIKRMTDYDGVSASPPVSRYFEYENPYIISPIDPVLDYLTITERIDAAQSGSICNFVKWCRNSTPRYSLGSIRGGNMGYGKVTTLRGAAGEIGRTVHRYSNAADGSVDLARLFPYPPTDNRDWRRGLLQSKTEYAFSGVPITRDTLTYEFAPGASVTCFKAGIASVVNPCNDPYGYCGIQFIFYLTSTETVRQLTQTETTYVSASGVVVDSLVTSTSFFFDNPANVNAVRTETTDSKGQVIRKVNHTPLEKSEIVAGGALSSEASAAIDAMLTKNIVGTVIESLEYVDSETTRKVLTNFKTSAGVVVPSNVMLKNGSGPLETRIQFPAYDGYFNLAQQNKVLDISHSYLWAYKGKYPVAEIVNAPVTAIAYSSFEAEEGGGWTIPGATVAGGVTGTRAYNIAVGNITRSGLDATKTYVITVWSNGTGVRINTQVPTAGRTFNGWTCYAISITASSITVSGTGLIDELRLYPQGAMMTTYTYEPLVGVTSKTDPNNQTTWFEYDGAGRLVTVKDHEQNIVKRYEYHYQAR